MLVAIHALIHRMGLFDESLEGSTVTYSQELYSRGATAGRRQYGDAFPSTAHHGTESIFAGFRDLKWPRKR